MTQAIAQTRKTRQKDEKKVRGNPLNFRPSEGADCNRARYSLIELTIPGSSTAQVQEKLS